MALSKNKKEKTKKKGKKWIVVLVIALILGAGSCGGDTDSEEKPVENESVVEEVATINPSQPRNQTNSCYSPLHVCRKDPSIWREAVVLIVEPLR